MGRTIKLKRYYDHSPQELWDCLTNSEKLAVWLMENDFKPVVGHKFRFVTYPKVKFGFDGIIYGEVLEVQANKRLRYAWRGGPGDGTISLDTVVTWNLSPHADGTLLTMEHSGFKGFRNLLPFIIMRKGWEKIMRLKLTKQLISQVNAKVTG